MRSRIINGQTIRTLVITILNIIINCIKLFSKIRCLIGCRKQSIKYVK